MALSKDNQDKLINKMLRGEFTDNQLLNKLKEISISRALALANIQDEKTTNQEYEDLKKAFIKLNIDNMFLNLDELASKGYKVYIIGKKDENTLTAGCLISTFEVETIEYQFTLLNKLPNKTALVNLIKPVQLDVFNIDSEEDDIFTDNYIVTQEPLDNHKNIYNMCNANFTYNQTRIYNQLTGEYK